MMTDMNMNEFLEVLSSSAPVPGGGGACGYVAAVGMSLGSMVANLTTGKKKYAEYQEEIEKIITEAKTITKELAECMDKDAVSFEPLSKAYGLPKNTDEEIAYREEVMEKALVTASEAPLLMMETIYKALKVLERLAVIGSRIAISDVGVGVQMCKAAVNGASLNVYINTKMMKNTDIAEEMNTRADELVIMSNELADRTYEEVMEVIR
ncbi:MAG: cyclodeaminase/cyclohydrolase family protein [Lachnospira sp.]|nr:cyclodeaminase/cyclohydrolase family protein [Lachnospira sp.]MDD5827813.1 cyclodeaminase/cyclohydrolase family protein [Lachnospira sp.]